MTDVTQIVERDEWKKLALSKTELYGYLLDILSEYQLPAGKLDGHRLLTDLVNAKRYPALIESQARELAALRRVVPGLVEALGAVAHEIESVLAVSNTVISQGHAAPIHENLRVVLLDAEVAAHAALAAAEEVT